MRLVLMLLFGVALGSNGGTHHAHRTAAETAALQAFAAMGGSLADLCAGGAFGHQGPQQDRDCPACLAATGVILPLALQALPTFAFATPARMPVPSATPPRITRLAVPPPPRGPPMTVLA